MKIVSSDVVYRDEKEKENQGRNVTYTSCKERTVTRDVGACLRLKKECG